MYIFSILMTLLLTSCLDAADKTKKSKKMCQRSGKGEKQRQVKALNNITKAQDLTSPKNLPKVDEYFELQVSPKSAK